VALIVLRVTDGRQVRWILVAPRRLGLWLLDRSARGSGAATDGVTWTPSLGLRMVVVKRVGDYAAASDRKKHAG